MKGTKPLDEDESEKAGLKLSIQKSKIMTSSAITSWQIDGANVETYQISFSWASEAMWTVTAAIKVKDTCSLEEKL